MMKATARKYGRVYKPRIYHSVESPPGRFMTGYDRVSERDFATRVEAVASAEEARQKSLEKWVADNQALRERRAANEQAKTAVKEEEHRIALEQGGFPPWHGGWK
jgi:hypothetical protein